MDLRATIVVKNIEVNLEGKGSIVATVDFKIGGQVISSRNLTRVSIPLSDELRGRILETITTQIGEKIGGIENE